jgi:hypothetical protein
MRKPKTSLTILPRTKRTPKVPKPKVQAFSPDPTSRRGVRSRINISVPGVKTI